MQNMSKRTKMILAIAGVVVVVGIVVGVVMMQTTSSQLSGAAASVTRILRVVPRGKTTLPCGSNWATDACSLQTALGSASSGDEIWVMKGKYVPTRSILDRNASFKIDKAISIYGGFAGTETTRNQRDPATQVTILSGDIDNNDINADKNNIDETTSNIVGNNSYHVVTVSNSMATGAVLDGFTITGGKANNDSDCSATSTNGCGGGVVINSGNPTFSNITIIGNLANNSMFTQHTGGGGMFIVFATPNLTNVTFTGNSAANGGGMFIQMASPTLTNVTFNNNVAYAGGGIYDYWGSNPTLINTTFSQNTATMAGSNVTDRLGSAIFMDGNVGIQIYNSIFWGDDATEIVGAATLSDSVIAGGCPSGATCTNIITDDPLLDTIGDYGGSTKTFPLLPGSSAIDATSDHCPAADQRGVARSSPTCDIGAFESQ